jgi:hypothetical protein
MKPTARRAIAAATINPAMRPLWAAGERPDEVPVWAWVFPEAWEEGSLLPAGEDAPGEADEVVEEEAVGEDDVPDEEGVGLTEGLGSWLQS